MKETQTTTVDITSVRFQKPATATFSTGGAVLSIISLMVMAALSALLLLQLVAPASPRLAWLGHALPFLRPAPARGALAAWTWLPFVFTLFGAGVGALFELRLLLAGAPFQQTGPKGSIFVRDLRLLNLAPVTASIFFAIGCLTVADPALRLALLYLAAAGAFGLGFTLFFGGGPVFGPAILLGVQAVQAVMVLASGPLAGGMPVAALLVAQAALQATALVIGTATPLRSTGFHVLATVSGVLLYRAVVLATGSVPGFSHLVASALPSGSLARWGLVAACLGGIPVAARLSPRAYNRWRAAASDVVWSLVYYVLVSAPRLPKPLNLSQVYASGKPAPTRLQPYSLRHPENLSQTLGIPAVVEFEEGVLAFGAEVRNAKAIFGLIGRLDRYLPQADVDVPLRDKPRLPVWSDGRDYWPTIFTMKIFGRAIPGRTLDPTPAPAIEAFREGHLLAYLAESGIAAAMLAPVKERGEGALVLDLGFLDGYETKPDYEPYGGRVYFRVNSERERLEVVSVVMPGQTDEIEVDPADASFRRAESIALASLHYHVISGKHLAELHMTHNLIEVALHNAFDVEGQWAHPFRTFLYLHLYLHELAEEVTTEHLVADGAVFTQIFATTHDAMIAHLNDAYRNFEYGADEDFDARAALMTMASKGPRALLPHAAITWELRYAEIWMRYTTALIDAIYPDDQAVQADRHLQAFHAELVALLPRGLPPRHGALRTKAGVARYAADTIHHLVVRHQIYGTTALRAALDPRICAMQVPRDGGTQGVDEWRSLICIGLATGRQRFSLLRGDFTYLIDGVAEAYDAPMRRAFTRLQEDLENLEAEWTATPKVRAFTYDYMRALPSSLHTGPGY